MIKFTNNIFDMKDMRLADIILGSNITRQTLIAISTMESEFIALDKCRKKAEWLRHFLEDISKVDKACASNLHSLE